MICLLRASERTLAACVHSSQHDDEAGFGVEGDKGRREQAYVVKRKKFGPEDDIVFVVRFWVREEMDGYGSDVGSGDEGELGFAAGGVDFAFVAGAGEMLVFGEILWCKGELGLEEGVV